MKIKPFGVEQWMNEWETRCAFNLAETCVESITFGELLELSGKRETILAELSAIKLTYGAIEGSVRLRSAVAALYEKQGLDNVLITHGAAGANALVYETLVEPGDRVVSLVPTYQQHYSIPEAYGADVQLLRLRPEHRFLPDLDELRRVVTPGTKLISMSNPNNPTGALMDKQMLAEIAAIASQQGAYLLCDEVYRGTDQAGNGFTESVADLYERGISTASVSKAFSLAGLRLGWIATNSGLLKQVEIHRDYNTISVGILDDLFAAIALENRHALQQRNQRIVRENLAILDEWVRGEPTISYVRPASATVCLLKYEHRIGSREFCVRLLQSKGVMFTPGSVLDMEGHLRVGFANNKKTLIDGLRLVSEFLRELPH
jgi:aspartate/methionine/tyrosine aminotransferase